MEGGSAPAAPVGTQLSANASERASRPLRIAMVADPYLPVPPVRYGGIERVIAMLIGGLARRGHEVTLWAAPGSTVDAEIVTYGCPPHRSQRDRLLEIAQVALPLVRRRATFDLVHSFGRLAALLPILPLRIPKIQTYQRAITPRAVRWGSRLAGESLLFTACSDATRRPVSHIGRWATVYNGAPKDRFEFVPSVAVDAPLVFLGRLERIKGAHTAIDVALASGRRLVLAGNVVEEPEALRYFEEEIRPRIDGVRIQYAGPVDDAQKNERLGAAAALLMPVEWEEPFGIVMAEALACGTPVIGFRRGAVPEVVEEGLSGFVCDSRDQMVAAVGRLGGLDRRACRARYEASFSDDAVVEAYLRLYAEQRARVSGER